MDIIDTRTLRECKTRKRVKTHGAMRVWARAIQFGMKSSTSVTSGLYNDENKTKRKKNEENVE